MDKPTSSGMTGLSIPAQTIPVPSTISPQAQAFLAQAAQRVAPGTQAGMPPEAQLEAMMGAMRSMAAGFAGSFETIELGNGALLYHAVPTVRRPGRERAVFFDIHGGGFVSGAGEMCAIRAKLRAADFGVELFSVDYRLAPTHPWPAALDDTLAAWRGILERVPATSVAVAGSSAGGNLAAGLMRRAHDEGLDLPAALLLLTPALDLTGAGDSWHTNRWLDTTLYGETGETMAGYIGDADPADPLVSPINDTPAPGWPPTLLSSGTRDLLLSDTVRMHRQLRRAGIVAELHVTEAGPHGGFMGQAPEDRELLGEVQAFCDRFWG